MELPTSRRVLDFVATLQDPGTLPSARERWLHLQRMRQAAYQETWSHAVLRALELEEYARAANDNVWLASVLGIGVPQVERALEVLKQTGQVALRRNKWVSLPVTAVATGRDPASMGILTRAWTEVALQRLHNRQPGHFGYSLFSISRADMRRLRELHVEYLRDMQSIIARSTPNECVGLLCLQLLDLSERDDNALAPDA